MSHNIERVDGKYCFAYAGQKAWHGLGKNIPSDLSPRQIQEAVGLDWTVTKHDVFTEVNGEQIKLSRQALIRDSDNKFLDIVSNDWEPLQNSEAFDFYNDFIESNEMTMETAGSLQGGQIVFALAKLNESFDINKSSDTVDAYLLFTNYHKFGYATDIRFTPIRVVCNNTISIALRDSAIDNRQIKLSHRNKFDSTRAKNLIGVFKEKLLQYADAASYLSQSKAADEDIVTYLRKLFPTGSEKKPMSRKAQICYDLMETQPGAEYAQGTWWNAFNSVTFANNHVFGSSDENRVKQLFYGYGKDINIQAMELALEMAS